MFSARFSPVMTIPPSAPEQTAAALADLYTHLTMRPDLLAAHRAHDRAVMTAYSFDLKMTRIRLRRRTLQTLPVLATSRQEKGTLP